MVEVVQSTELLGVLCSVQQAGHSTAPLDTLAAVRAHWLLKHLASGLVSDLVY